jgi:carbon storage regulator CsrA
MRGNDERFGKSGQKKPETMRGSLELSRKAGQSIEIGDGDVVVFVKKVTGNRVQLIIRADRNVKIMRTEKVERDDSIRQDGVSESVCDGSASEQQQAEGSAQLCPSEG